MVEPDALSAHPHAPYPGSHARWFLPALAAIFFISGTSALVYQVLWLRLLGLVFGVTVYAASTVWASFMAGLTIGSFAAGRLADRVRRPLLWFAAAELGIAASAIVTPWALRTLQARTFALAPGLEASFASATALRFGISFVVLLVPTALMGATLPLVLKSSSWSSAGLGASSALLYASNTAGAIAGTLVAGLYSLPMLGMTATFRIAGTLNLSVALAASVLGKRLATEPSGGGDAGASDKSAAVVSLAAPARAMVLATFAISGAVSLGLELIWLRLSTLILGPTVYVVSLMLAGVLLGIAIGSYAVTPFLRRRHPGVGTLAILEAAIALSVLLSIFLLTKVPATVSMLPTRLTDLLPPYIVPIIVSSVIVTVPPMLLMGVAFPIGLQLWTVRADDPSAARFASRLGTFYSLNVFGAIVGSLLMGFYLLPRFGSRFSILAACAATMASAIALVAVAPIRGTIRFAGAAVLAGVFVVLARAQPSTVDALLMLRHPGEPILWREEGVQTTASVQAIVFGRRRALYLDGYHQADDTGGLSRAHHQIGALPLLVHPNPRTALVVGLGGGATAGALARASTVDVTVIELADTVIRAAPFFQSINFNLLERPNVHLRVDDGRNFLALTHNRYDIITADAIPPVRAGSASLYSLEYFELVKHALNDSGVVLQWLGGSDAQWRLAARTFLTVFPDATVWGGGDLLVGTNHPLRLDRADFTVKRQIPGFTDAFDTIGIRSFDDFARMFVAGPEELRRFLGDGPILTDDRPILEYFLSQSEAGFDVKGLHGSVLPFLAQPPASSDRH